MNAPFKNTLFSCNRRRIRRRWLRAVRVSLLGQKKAAADGLGAFPRAASAADPDRHEGCRGRVDLGDRQIRIFSHFRQPELRREQMADGAEHEVPPDRAVLAVPEVVHPKFAFGVLEHPFDPPPAERHGQERLGGGLRNIREEELGLAREDPSDLAEGDLVLRAIDPLVGDAGGAAPGPVLVPGLARQIQLAVQERVEVVARRRVAQVDADDAVVGLAGGPAVLPLDARRPGSLLGETRRGEFSKPCRHPWRWPPGGPIPPEKAIGGSNESSEPL